MERTSLEFRGGHGSPTGISGEWVQSLVDRPAIVKAKLERLSYLLTSRFFPDQEYIDQLQRLLDGAISRWIMTKGRSTAETAPLRYGEAVVLIWPWSDGKTEQIGIVELDLRNIVFPIQFPVRNGRPFYSENDKAALRILSSDGSNKNSVILAGDQVRIELIDAGLFDRNMLLTRNPSDAGRFTILHQDDDLRSPGRVGEYFQSSDRIAFMAAGTTGQGLRVNTWTTRNLDLAPIDRAAPETGFVLRRCAEREED